MEAQLGRSEKGSVSIAALICNLGTLRPFYLRGRSTGNQRIGDCTVPESVAGLEASREGRNFFSLPGIEPCFLTRPARIQVTTLTTLHYPGLDEKIRE